MFVEASGLRFDGKGERPAILFSRSVSPKAATAEAFGLFLCRREAFYERSLSEGAFQKKTLGGIELQKRRSSFSRRSASAQVDGRGQRQKGAQRNASVNFSAQTAMQSPKRQTKKHAAQRQARRRKQLELLASSFGQSASSHPSPEMHGAVEHRLAEFCSNSARSRRGRG